MKHKYLIVLLIILTSCKNKEAQPAHNPTPQTKSNDVETTYIDTAFEYESRTGTSGNYTYTYDIFGTDENGNEVSGTITIKGKYGTGTLLNSNENEIEVEAEWIDYGKLKATDDEGNKYQLEVSE
jgi:hypothetical protein